MFPTLVKIGSFEITTFGLMMFLAFVAAGAVLTDSSGGTACLTTWRHRWSCLPPSAASSARRSTTPSSSATGIFYSTVPAWSGTAD